MLKTVTTQLTRGKLIEVFVFLVALALFVFGIIPTTVKLIDAYRFEEDLETATQLNAWFNETEHTLDIVYEAFEVRAMIEKQAPRDVSFTPTSHNTGFFYLPQEQTIVALRFEEALKGNLSFTSPNTPSELFGAHQILLSLDGSSIARAVDNAYENARDRDFYREDHFANVRHIFQQAETWITNYILGMRHSPEIYTYQRAFEKHFSPENTLFVANNRWVTKADSGEDINNIVFYPGISNLPEFTFTRFAPNSIHFEEVILPKTIRSIQRHALPEAFDIERLVLTDTEDIFVEAESLTGVRTTTWSPEFIDRDHPSFHIDILFQGRPLVTYDPTPNIIHMALDLEHLRAYFDSINIEVVTYNTHHNLNDPSKSRIYIYTEQGYYGFVIPVPHP